MKLEDGVSVTNSVCPEAQQPGMRIEETKQKALCKLQASQNPLITGTATCWEA